MAFHLPFSIFGAKKFQLHHPPMVRCHSMQGEACNKVAKELKEGVRIMLHNVDDLLLQLELIDILGRLGLAYLYEDQIKLIMKNIYNHFDNWRQDNLYSKALGFRLLRQYGYKVSADFARPNNFKNLTRAK
ncbi:hypothetical protein ACFE04_012592 [Oxalis oulophora]